MSGLPLAYNKDLQEDKEYLFDAIDTVELLLPAMAGMIATARFRADRMAAAASGGFLAATDLADHLVAAGLAVPPRPRGRRPAGARVPRGAGVGLEDASGRRRRGGGPRGRRRCRTLTAEASVEAKAVPGRHRARGGRSTSSPRPARGWPRGERGRPPAARRRGPRLGADFFARAVAEVGPRPDRLHPRWWTASAA